MHEKKIRRIPYLETVCEQIKRCGDERGDEAFKPKENRWV